MKTIFTTIQLLTFSFILCIHSTNAQSTWQKLANFNDANAAVWMSASPTLNYAITADQWIYYSNNIDNVWTPFVDVPDFYTVGSIKASQVTNRVFCLTSSSGIVFTDNFGASWQNNNLGGGGGNSGFGPLMLAFGLNETTVLVSTAGPFTGEIENNIFISNDNGNTYSPLPALNFYPTGFHFLNSDQVISNTADGIFKTSNINGGTWTQIAFAGLEVTDIEIDGTTVYASVKDNDEGKVYNSTDSGENWTELSGIPANTNVTKIAFDNINQRLFATTTSGVFGFVDNAWSTISTSGKAHEIIITGNQSTLFSGIRINGIQKIDGTDLSLQSMNAGLVVDSDLMSVSADNQLYTASLTTSFLSRLNLNDLTWTSQTMREDLDFTRNISMGIASDGECVVGGMHFIAKTADEGNTITTIADETTAPLAPVYDILFPQKMFLGNNNSISMVQHTVQDYIDYSPDMGETWSVLFQNVSGQFPAFLNFTKVCSGLQNHYILGLSMQTAQNSVAFSADQGASWVILPNLPVGIRNMFIDRFDQLYVVTNSAIYSWDNTTQSWTPLNIDLGTTSSNKEVEVKFDYNNKMYVLVSSTTTPFAEEGFYISNENQSEFTHIPFEIQNGQKVALRNLSFSENNIPVAMTNLETRDFEIEGIYHFGDGLFLSAPYYQTEVLKVYPNPATNQVFISALENQNTMAQLVSVSGQSLAVKIESGILDVSQFANGFYVLKVNIDGKVQAVKLIINR